MCSEGYGITDGPGSSATGPTEFGPMQSWGINTVFIGLNEDCWLGINGVSSSFSGTAYINEIKAEVTQAESDGLYPVIGFFWGDPGSEVPVGSDWNGGGQEPLPDNDHAPLFWEEVADTFKNDSNVMFRLQEEPHPYSAGSSLAAWKCWSQGDVQYGTTSDNAYGTAPTPAASTSNCDTEYSTNGDTAYQTVGMQSLVNIIRGAGADNVIQIPGVGYANMLACSSTTSPTSCGFLDSSDGVKITDPLASPQLMADIDMYPDSGQTCDNTTCYNDTIAPVAQVMPVDLGETGYGGPADQTLLAWMNSHNQSNYYAWAWDTWAGLISDYSGTPSSPWGTGYKAYLTATTVPANTSSPTITGTAQEGQTLTANTGTWSPSGFPDYQWQDCTNSSGSSCTAISGATSSTYTPTASDVGDYINVVVSVDNSHGSTPATSATTAQIASLPQPTDGISFRQTQTATGSDTLTFSSAVTAGDDLFITIAGQAWPSASSGATITGVSDNINGAWAKVTDTGYQSNDSQHYVHEAVYELLNSATAAAGALTITINTPGSVSAVAMDTSGVASVTTATSSSVAYATPLNAPTITAANNDVILGMFGTYVSGSFNFTTTTGWNSNSNYWTEGNSGNGDPGAAIVWRQATAAGSTTPSIGGSGSLLGVGTTLDLKP